LYSLCVEELSLGPSSNNQPSSNINSPNITPSASQTNLKQTSSQSINLSQGSLSSNQVNTPGKQTKPIRAKPSQLQSRIAAIDLIGRGYSAWRGRIIFFIY